MQQCARRMIDVYQNRVKRPARIAGIKALRGGIQQCEKIIIDETMRNLLPILPLNKELEKR